jgi:hypothetical protein
MSTEIATQETQVVAQPQATSLLDAISRAASDPSMDMEKMERLFAMHERMVKTQVEAAFNADMALAQSEITTVVKNKKNEFLGTTYADLSAIIEAIAPVITKFGFSISFNSTQTQQPGCLSISATLSHKAGHSRAYELTVPIDAAGSGGRVNKTPVQAVGSTNSYARRYLICMIWNISTSDDNDGNRAKGTSATTGIAEVLNADQRKKVQEVASKMHAHLKSDSAADAVRLGEGQGFDADEQIFLWTFFDSKQRALMKKVSASLKQAAPSQPDLITDAQKKRIEARIVEAGITRDSAKQYCVATFGKEHFADLTKSEYQTLDEALDTMALASQA